MHSGEKQVPNEQKRIAISDGTVITVDVLRWDEGWDFDCPCCVLRPALRFSPNGDHTDELAESFAEDAAFNGYIESEPAENGVIDRQFPVALLKRRWRDAWNGKEFPRRQYTAARYRVRFYNEQDEGETILAYDVEEVDNDA